MDKPMLGPPTSTGKSSKPTSSDEKAPDSSDNGAAIKRAGWPKGKKRKKMPKDSSDPQKPLTAYLFFMKEHREKLRLDNPDWGFLEITKKLSNDWRSLTPDQRQQYTNAAEEDKGRYARELTVYKQSDAYKEFVKSQKNKAFNKKLKEFQNNSGLDDQLDKDDSSGFDIPIFTEEFLDHNRTREAELRQLRKANTDYEQQNSILEKLILNSKTAISKLEEETVQLRCHNVALQQYLDQIRVNLTKAFSTTSLPEHDTPTADNIDDYMAELHSLLVTQSAGSPLYAQVQQVVQKLDLHG